MMARVRSVIKQGLSRLTAWLVTRAGLLPIFLSLTHRWGRKRQHEQHLAFPFIERRRHPCFLILSYHRVNDEQDPFFGGVPVRIFARQMEVLHEYFNVFPLAELVESSIKHDVPPNAVAITFDDGYRDNYDNAFPVLKRFGLPATIFLVTGGMDSKEPLWHDSVFAAFRQTTASSVFIRGKAYPLRTLGEKRSTLYALLNDLRRQTPRDRDELVQQMILQLGVPRLGYESAQKLSWDEVREMAENHIAFGAHTATHPILTRMPLEQAAKEIMTSKEAIEGELGGSVRLFAYPNGSRDDYNESIKKVLREAGFLCAVTTLWGTNNVHTDLFELRRVGIWDLDPRISALKLGWYRFSS